MIRHQTSSPSILIGPLLLALLGTAFCVWSASGNALNLCVTTGCSLFQDFTLWGISMWWFGAAAFGALCLLALSGKRLLGLVGAGLCLLVDAGLLVLMLTTAPCVGCLFAALLFACIYVSFRHSAARREEPPSRSWLVLVWTVLFIANVGAVIKAETGTWAMHGPENAAVRLYFSPSCSACREAMGNLSGRVNVAYYPVAENEQDVATIAAMNAALEKGDSLLDALQGARNTELGSIWSRYAPDTLWLRFRLLCNKAHVLSSGSEAVPYLEFNGLPGFLSNASKKATSKLGTGASGTGVMENTSTDATLPIELGPVGSCGGSNMPPCP